MYYSGIRAWFSKVQQYIQLLWKDIDPFEKNLYYGAVEGAVTLLGAITSFAAGFLNSKKFDRLGMWVLTACSAIEGVFLMWASDTDSLYMCYFMYIAFGALHNFMITAARWVFFLLQIYIFAWCAWKINIIFGWNRNEWKKNSNESQSLFLFSTAQRWRNVCRMTVSHWFSALTLWWHYCSNRC